MYCPECKSYVQVDPSWKYEWTERDEFYYDGTTCDGPYERHRAGEEIEIEGKEWQIGLRVDRCYNCGEVLYMRTYTR